jgi:hypothetical protein
MRGGWRQAVGHFAVRPDGGRRPGHANAGDHSTRPVRAVAAHELFHRIQPQLKLMTTGGANNRLDTLEGRLWLQLEWRALARALEVSGNERRNPVRDALAFRRARRERFPGSAESERVVELREGLAEYTGIVVGIPTPADGLAFTMTRLRNTQTSTVSFLADFGYRSGAGYGLLLDAVSPGWPRRIGPADDLGQLLGTALGVQPADNPDAAAQRYDGAELRRAEDAREADRQRLIADLRRRFIDSPVVIMPRPRSVALTSTGRTPIPDVGTVVFGGYRATTEWGQLESTDAILEMNDVLRLPAPFRTQGTTLVGTGWTIVLADGWTVRPGPRSGDFEVIRTAGK